MFAAGLLVVLIIIDPVLPVHSVVITVHTHRVLAAVFMVLLSMTIHIPVTKTFTVIIIWPILIINIGQQACKQREDNYRGTVVLALVEMYFQFCGYLSLLLVLVDVFPSNNTHYICSIIVKECFYHILGNLACQT